MTERKDRLIQTRVDERLESTLKEEARRRRTTVSQVIRNVLEDTFELVDGVVANVDQIVSDSARFAEQIRRAGVRAWEGSPPCGEPSPGAGERLATVSAWQEVLLNREARCTRCGAALAQGSRAYAGLGGAGETWLCPRAVRDLQSAPAG